MSKPKKITQKQKIDILFDYIFNGNKHLEEELFWNKINESEINELEKRKKTDTISFDKFRSSL